MTDDSKMVEYLEHKIKYAANSYSRDLMHEALGMVNFASMVDSISSDEYVRLSSVICHDYLNNSKWFKHPFYH